MAQKTFRTLHNHSTLNVIVNGNTVAAGATQLIFLNPAFLANNLGDIVSLYTQQLIDLYDETDTVIAPADVWDSINYNIDALSNVGQSSGIYAATAFASYSIVSEEYLHLTGGTVCTVTVASPFDGQELKIVNHNSDAASFGTFTIATNTTSHFRYCTNAWALFGRYANA